MAEYTPTAASVIATGVVAQTLVAGEAITAGQLIYKAADTMAYLAQCDGTAIEAQVLGMALNNAAAGQPVHYAAGGDNVEITLQTDIFADIGQVLVLGPTAGKFSDASDLDTPNSQRVTLVGWSTATNKMRLKPILTGVQRPANE